MRSVLALLLSVASLANAAPDALTWSPADHSPQVSVNGATATRSSLASGAFQSARSDTAQSVGVRTVTFNIVQVGSPDGTGPGMWVGLGNGRSPLNDYSGATNDGVSYDARGRVLKNVTATLPSPPSYTTGDVVAMQVDFTAKTVKFNKNGGSWSATTDITSLGPEVYVTCSLGNGTARATVQIVSDDWNDLPGTTMYIVAHGDSITLTGGVMQTYHPRLLNLIYANRVDWAEGRHLGINGHTWNFAWSDSGYPYSLIQDAPLRVDPLRSPSIPSWLIAFAGTNGFTLFGRTVTQEYADLQAYVRARIAAGWPPDRIIIPTMMPRTGVSETLRSTYNALILADTARLGYRVARLDLDPSIGAAGQNRDTAWFRDGVHPTDAGHDVIARIIYATMFP